MAEDRYWVGTRQVLGSGTGRTANNRGNKRVTVYVVKDRNTGRVAKGTKGFEGTGGYATEREAKNVASKMNRDLARALQEKATREKKRRSE